MSSQEKKQSIIIFPPETENRTGLQLATSDKPMPRDPQLFSLARGRIVYSGIIYFSEKSSFFNQKYYC